jgi:hypothetical protein
LRFFAQVASLPEYGIPSLPADWGLKSNNRLRRYLRSVSRHAKKGGAEFVDIFSRAMATMGLSKNGQPALVEPTEVGEH